MLNIAVCDDNKDFLQYTAALISKWSEERNHPCRIFTYDNGDSLLEEISEGMHIIFLDIMMPFSSGMDAAREIRKKDTAAQIVFITSSPEFALQSYEVKAQDYILKPVNYGRLKNVLDSLTDGIRNEPEHAIIKISEGYRKIYFHNIEYVEAQNKNTMFCLTSGELVRSPEALHYIEEKCSHFSSFFKCHRSYIVNLDNIKCLGSSEVITISGQKIPVARGCAKTLKEKYFSLMFKD